MLRLKKLSFVNVLLFLIFPFVTQAQITFSGHVIDADSKESLSFVSVWVKGTNNAVYTQLDGSFSLSGIKSTDTVQISALGYKDYEILGRAILKTDMEVVLIPDAIKMDVVTVSPGKNPAIPIVKKAIRNRHENRPDGVKNIELIEYNKLNFSLSGIDSSVFNVGFIRKHADILVKTNDYDDTWNIPLYFSEYMTYQKLRENRAPEVQEIVKNQHGSSFIESDIVTKYIESLNEDMTFYGNLRFLQKDFISPIATQALVYYRYYLDDSLTDNGKTYYRLRFKPKNSQDLAFFGYMIIEKESGTLTEIDATLQPTSILNFVRKMRLFEKLQLTSNDEWFRRQQKMTVEFVPDLVKDTSYRTINTPITAIKSTTYIIDTTQINDFLVNRVVPGKFNLRRSQSVTRDTTFLNQYRPDTLSSLDLITQKAIEKSNDIGAVKAVNKLLNMFMYGYLPFGYIDIGPYLYFVQSNKIEGIRLNLCFRTSEKFHDKMLFGGYLGYGCRNHKFKYGLQYSLRMPSKYYGALHLKYDQNIYRIGDFRQPLDFVRENVLVQSDDNLLSAVTAQNENEAVYFVKRGVVAYEQQISPNLILKPAYTHAIHYNPPYVPFTDNNNDTISQIRTQDISFDIRLSYKEAISNNHFRRLYIDSRYPVCHLNISQNHYSFNNVSDWYTQLRLVVRHEILIGVGRMKYVVEAGMLTKPVPFPLLEVHRGNETGSSGEYYFNHMNYMEFASDAFVNLYAEYGMNGFFFNKIWLLRKLQLRELLTFKACYGRMLNDNNSILTLPQNTFELNMPYMEAGIGVTNLLKFIRLEYIWRLNYLDHSDISKKGLYIRFNFEF
ncbi:MAG: carboxypeptidase-like regulatory domain-containing protein [Bacteroidales bacterium]|nr:carboxypeptidase-like regulatory domain-containing protein [Bacteroidales bacterium]